jgi:RND family efflux transporter MFP subunit
MPDMHGVDLSKLQIRREHHDEPKSLPRSRYWLVLYIGCAVFLGLGIFLFYRTLTDEIVVELTPVSLVSKTQASAVLTASGYVVAQRKAAIASKATGRLVYLGFKEGDKVREGEIIARIESADMEAGLSQARADLAVAQADRNDAERSLERSRELRSRQLISQAEFDAAAARRDRVAAVIASREAGLRAAEVNVENTRIRAPFNGTILTKNADIGEVVAPFGAGASSRVAVVTIADMGSLEVEADVSESNIERVVVGQQCEISLDAYPDQRYRGQVDKIVPTADRAKATVLTKVRFLELDQRVLPEMSAKVSFLAAGAAQSAAGAKPVVAVDAAAVTTDAGRDVVFRYADEQVTEVSVTLGERLGSLVEVKDGLAPGDKVVLKPSPKLTSESRVKLKQ